MVNRRYDKIVLVSIDTLRSDCIASNPHKLYPAQYRVETQVNRARIDEIVDRSAFFLNTISAAPYTSTSHASYFTGRWPRNHGVHDQFGSRLSAPTVFQFAKEFGYETIFKTDFEFVLGSHLNFLVGVDAYYVEDNEGALARLKQSSKALAFFHFGQVHYPYGFHNLKYEGDNYREKVYALERELGLPGVVDESLSDMAYESRRGEEDLQLLFRYKTIISKLYAERRDDFLFNLYLEGINYFHKHTFNSFLDNLLSDLNGEAFLLIIFSDHGEAWNDDSYGHHNSLDEGVLRVPLLFMGSEVYPSIHEERVRTIDLVPTLLMAMGEADRHLDGSDLCSSVFQGISGSDRDTFSSIWMTDIKDIVSAVQHLANGMHAERQSPCSVRYGVSARRARHHLVHFYQKLADRGREFQCWGISELQEILSLTSWASSPHSEIASSLLEWAERLNDIIPEVHEQPEALRQLLRLQGYQV